MSWKLILQLINNRQFFKSVCDVPEPEEKFNMDEFSDAVLLSKPVIFISLKEVIDTHRVCCYSSVLKRNKSIST